MRFNFVILLFSISISIKSQNLIPNYDFEEHIGDSVCYWIQPQGIHYHYENSHITTGENHINGICVWNATPSEYLNVKLKSKLIKNQKYYLAFYLSQYMNLEGFGADADITSCNEYLDYEMSCYFSNQKIETKYRTQLYQKPQINFRVDDDNKKYKWNLFEAEFIATGNEEYFTIGYFFNREFEDKKLEIQQLIYDSLKLEFNNYKLEKTILEKLQNTELETERKLISEQYTDYSIEKLYTLKKKKEFNEYNRYIMEKNHKITVITREILLKFEEKNRNLDFQHVKRINDLNNSSPNNYCHTRFYLDNISLTPIQEFASFDTLNKMAGKTFQLNNIFFDIDKSEILANSTMELNRLFSFLRENSKVKIEISGHTDNTGSEEHNIELSQARAKSVADFLITIGIEEERITYRGYGSSMPITDNNSEKNRLKNRRVEFKILE
jgi:outer membrane protein OmpA-like peptidoglycan-associated protein